MEVMEGWGVFPLLPPVEFDFAAATDAIAACRDQAAKLDVLLQRRARAQRAATHEWQGRYRRDFDDVADALQREGHDLREQLLRTAAAIAEAAERAAGENARRHRENQRRIEAASHSRTTAVVSPTTDVRAAPR